MFYYFAIIRNLYKSKSYPEYCDNMNLYCSHRYVHHYNISNRYNFKPDEKSNIINAYCATMWFYHSLFSFNYWIKCHKYEDKKIMYMLGY